MNHDMEQLEHLARIGAIQEHARWSSWGSPVGLTIFLNGLILGAILIRFAFLMK